MNKRDFLAGAAALACTATRVQACDAAASASAQPSARRLRRQPDLAAAPSLAAWRAYLGDRFGIAAWPDGATLELSEVRALAHGGPAEQFTLHFTTVGDALAPIGLHTLQHANGQRLAVYLDAAGAQGRVAHFNRLA